MLKKSVSVLLLGWLAAAYAGGLPTVGDELLAADRTPDAELAPLAGKRAELLALEPVSVTFDKKLVAPTGDKRDYISTGRYWWPDPEKPDGLPYIRRDGVSNPDAEQNDFGRLCRVCAAVCELAPLYYFNGDEEAAFQAVRLLRAFFTDPETGMRPHLAYAQSVPGREDGRPIGIIDTYILIDLVDSIAMLEGSEAMTPEEYRALQEWFRNYMTWMRSESMTRAFEGLRHNIAISYHAQIAAYAVFAGEETVAREHLARLEAMLPDAIREDGVLPHEVLRTRSWGYSVYALDILFSAVSTAHKLGLDWTAPETETGRLIRGAVDHLCGYIGREAEWPYQQLDGPIDTDALGNVLRKMAYFTGEEAYRQYYRRLPHPRSPRITALFYPEP